MSTREYQHYLTVVGVRFADPRLNVTVTQDETMIFEDMGWQWTCRGCGARSDSSLSKSEVIQHAKQHADACTGAPVGWTPPANNATSTTEEG